MNLQGYVEDGVVILESGAPLPEGAAVTITYPAVPQPKPAGEKRRIQVSLVRTGEPGILHLTNARIAEILDQEDGSGR